MDKNITLQLSESLEQQLSQKAAQLNISLESFIIDVLEQYNSEDKAENDPITPLIGTLKMKKNDLAENHDFYLSQALQQELKGVE